MSPNAWTATARAVERTASSCEAPHARDAACLFAAHPGAVAAAAARRDALWPASRRRRRAVVRHERRRRRARARRHRTVRGRARDALTANPAAALRLAKAFERVARPNVGDADNVATALFTVLGWNGPRRGEQTSADGTGARRKLAARTPSRAYAYGRGMSVT